MEPYEIIYSAKDRIRRNETIITRALLLRDYSMVDRLRRENEKIRREILKKYAVII